MQIESGNEVLKDHIETGNKNAQYTSPRIQNEIINLCGGAIKDMIVKDIKEADAYSVLADESCDISGKEQLSIGVRFFDEKKGLVREEFLGFIELEAMDARTIANCIDDFLENCEFDPINCVGQGYDGCSTMAGKDNGVAKKLQEKYPLALYFHCASHRLNLVVNDLNVVAQIRNTLGTVKCIINFFRESIARRAYVPNIPEFCDTRWSQRYKSTSIFKRNFEDIVEALELLSTEGNNSATKSNAFQLHCAATKPVFIICLSIIAKYSAMLEPIVNALQGKSIDLFSCTSHIRTIVSNINEQRADADNLIKEILNDARKSAEDLGVQLTLPRAVQRQMQNSNNPTEFASNYWRDSTLIPYLDSLIASLEARFAESNSPAFSLLCLHPANMLKEPFENLKLKASNFVNFYKLQNLMNEIELWYQHWAQKDFDDVHLKDLELCDVVKETGIFFPDVKRALVIAIAQPCTTCTIERSFSTLRRVKTWLRSTMVEDRLNGN